MGIYVVGLHKYNRAKARPMFKTDAKFLVFLFWMVAATFSDSWSGRFELCKQVLSMVEWARLKLVCICKMLVVKVVMHILYDNCQVPLEHWAGIKLRMSREFNETWLTAANFLFKCWCELVKRLRWFGSRIVQAVVKMALCVHSGIVALQRSFVDKWTLNDTSGGCLQGFNDGLSMEEDCSSRGVLCGISKGGDSDESATVECGIQWIREDDDTKTTATESFGGVDSLSARSDDYCDHSVSCVMPRWSVVVNGTHYLGHLRTPLKATFCYYYRTAASQTPELASQCKDSATQYKPSATEYLPSATR